MESSDVRQIARDVLRGKWTIAVIVTFVAALLGGLISGSGFELNFEIDDKTLQYVPEFVISYLRIVAPIATVLGIVHFLIGGAVRLGHCQFMLNLYDNKPVDIRDLFSHFDRFLDALVMNLLSSLFVALWTLLFIIPGIVAGYRYAMAPFILAENPGMGGLEAITASKELMRGYKFDLFVLDLSFIGWALLNVLTLGIGSLWLNPYESMAHTVFYRNLCPAQIVDSQAEGTEFHL